MKSIDNRSKNKQVQLHQTKTLLHSTEINRQKRKTAYDWEKVFANHLSDKGLTTKIRKILTQLNSKRKKKSE